MKLIIKKLEIISFGCLKNKTLTPSEGINKITAPNESGKSTLAAFIKFIFYGFGSSKKDIMDSHKKLYLPWDSPFAAGSAEISADGVLYRIERKYAPSQKEVLSITEVSTGKVVYKGLCPGEVFFGVDMETAEKTFIFDQYCALTARDSELFDSIRNIIFSGDESGKNEAALKRLKEAKKELKNSRGGGTIEALEKEFTSYKTAYDKSMEKISTLKDISSQIALLEKNIERNNANEKKLLAEKENLEKYESLLKLHELEELEKEAINAENAYRIAVSTLEDAGVPDGELIENLVNVNAEKLSKQSISAELTAGISKVEGELSSLNSKNIESAESTEEIKENLSKKSSSTKLSFGVAGVSGIAGIVFALLNPESIPLASTFSVILMILAAVFTFLAVSKNFAKGKYIKGFGVNTETELLALLNVREETVSQISQKKEEKAELKNRLEAVKKDLLQCEETLSSVLGRYFKNSTEDSAELIRKLRALTEKVAEAKKVAESQRESLRKTSELLDRETLLEKAKGAVKPERPSEEIEKQLKFVQNGKRLMEEKIIEAKKEKAVIESSIVPPAVMFEKAEAVYKKLNSSKERLEAIELAIEIIEKASDEMKATLAPKITSYASELFEIATDGKYKALNVTTELSLTTDDGETVKSAEYLSAGARATAYICLRLALLKAVYNDTFPIIIFDDAFVRLDAKRLEQINKAIMSSPAKDTQIFIFSATE